MRLSCRWRFFLALAVSGIVAQAAEKMTLAQALEFADRQHPELQAGAALVEGAQAGVTTARAYPNPSALVSTGRQGVRVAGNVSGPVTLLAFEQPLELGALRSTRVQLADRFRESSVLALAEIRLAVLTGVRRTFFQVLRRRGEIDIASQNLRLVEDLRQRIQVRVDVGEAGRLELVRADAEVAAARTMANSAQLQLVTALSEFQAATGVQIGQDLNLQGSLDPMVALPPLEELRAETLDRHPSLRLAQSEIRRAESRIKFEKAQRRPQPSLRADIERYPDVPNYRVGLAIPLPLWNRREGPIAEAAAELARATSRARARQMQLLAALAGTYGRYQVATQQLSAFEHGLLREAEEAVRAAEVAYRLGERGILEVLDSQRVLRTVRLGFLNAQYDRQAALVDLDELRAVNPRSN